MWLSLPVSREHPVIKWLCWCSLLIWALSRGEIWTLSLFQRRRRGWWLARRSGERRSQPVQPTGGPTLIHTWTPSCSSLLQGLGNQAAPACRWWPGGDGGGVLDVGGSQILPRQLGAGGDGAGGESVGGRLLSGFLRWSFWHSPKKTICARLRFVGAGRCSLGIRWQSMVDLIFRTRKWLAGVSLARRKACQQKNLSQVFLCRPSCSRWTSALLPLSYSWRPTGQMVSQRSLKIWLWARSTFLTKRWCGIWAMWALPWVALPGMGRTLSSSLTRWLPWRPLAMRESLVLTGGRRNLNQVQRCLNRTTCPDSPMACWLTRSETKLISKWEKRLLWRKNWNGRGTKSGEGQRQLSFGFLGKYQDPTIISFKNLK